MSINTHSHEASPLMVFHDLESTQPGTKLDTWPLHISITPFFTLQDVTPEEAIDVITTTSQKHSRIHIKLGEQAMYGPDSDMPVTRIIDSSGELAYLHRSLIHKLGKIGCKFVDLTYALNKYSPHISHKNSNPIPILQPIDSISVVAKLAQTTDVNKIILNNIPLG